MFLSLFRRYRKPCKQQPNKRRTHHGHRQILENLESRVLLSALANSALPVSEILGNTTASPAMSIPAGTAAGARKRAVASVTASVAAGAGQTVVGRYLAYGSTPRFGDIIAPDKTALLPGQSASFANVSSYSAGINEIVIDVANPAGSYSASDFTLRAGLVGDPSTWAAAPAPSSITAAAGAGIGGSTRITLHWNNGQIINEWLQVTLNAAGDTFYFGSLPGDTGGASGNPLMVSTADEAAVSAHPASLLNPATVTNVYDFNRDGKVNSVDDLIARNSNWFGLSNLQAPAVTTQSPVVTTTSPVTTTTSSVVATSPLVDTTTPPATTSTSPVVTTSSSMVTTNPLVDTTTPPVDTTTSSVVTTSPLVDTTTPPVVTTTSPVDTTTSPVVTTSSSVVTTSPLVDTTTPPPTTTTQPAVPAYDWHTQVINGVLNVWAPNPSDFGTTFAVTSPTALFGTSGVPHITDIKQGPIADCYFLSAAGSLAMNNPSLIESIVKNDSSGGWAVTFQYQSPSTGNYQPVVFHTDDELSASMQNEVNGEVWSLVLEKAYAAFRTWNGSTSTDTMASLNWGFPSAALMALGDSSHSVSYTMMNSSSFASAVQSDLSAHAPILFQTSSAAPDMVQSHVYTVTGVSTDASGTVWVTLYNPWGSYETRTESDMLSNGIGYLTVGNA